MVGKILIIDTDPAFGGALRSSLQQLGFNAEIVQDGDEGIHVARFDPPVAIFLGLMGDKGAGYGICSKLRRRAGNVPVFMTIPEQEQGAARLEKHRSLRTRADAYITVPFTFETLTGHLSHLIEQSADSLNVDLSQQIGGVEEQPDPAALPSALFGGDELAAIEAEADFAFESLLNDEPTATHVEAILTEEVSEELVVEETPIASEVGPPAAQGSADLSVDLESQLVESTDITPSPSRSDAAGLEPTTTGVPTGAHRTGSSGEPGDPVILSRENRDLRSQNRELIYELRRTRDEFIEREKSAIAQRETTSSVKLEIITLKEELNRHQHKNLELRDELVAKERVLLGLNDRVADARTEVDRLETELREADERDLAHRHAREAAEREVDTLRERLTQADTAAMQANNEVGDLRRDLEEVRSKASQARHLREDRDKDAAQAERLRRTLEDLRATVATERLGHKKALSRAEQARLEAIAEAEKAAEARFEAIAAEHEAALDTARAEAQAAQSEIQATHKQALETQREALETAHREEQERERAAHAAALESADEAREGRLQSLASVHASALETAELAASERRMALESELDEAKRALESYQSGAQDIDAQLKAQRTELEAGRLEAEQTASDLLVRLESQTTELERSRGEHEDALDALRAGRERLLNSAQAENSRLRGELEASQDLLEEELRRASDLEKRLRADLDEERSRHEGDESHRDRASEELLAKRLVEIETLGARIAELELELNALRHNDVALRERLDVFRAAEAHAHAAIGQAQEALEAAYSLLDSVGPVEAQPGDLVAAVNDEDAQPEIEIDGIDPPDRSDASIELTAPESVESETEPVDEVGESDTEAGVASGPDGDPGGAEEED